MQKKELPIIQLRAEIEQMLACLKLHPDTRVRVQQLLSEVYGPHLALGKVPESG